MRDAVAVLSDGRNPAIASTSFGMLWPVVAFCLLLLLPLYSLGAQNPASERTPGLPDAGTDTVSPAVLQQIRASSISLDAVVSRRSPATSGVLSEVVGHAWESPREEIDTATVSSLPEQMPSPSVDDSTQQASVIDLAALRHEAGIAAVELHSVRGDAESIDLAGLEEVTLEQGHILTIRHPLANPIISMEHGAAQAVSPTRLLTVDASGVLRQLSLVHRVQELTWSHEENRYTGTLLIGLIDATRPRDFERLAMPVPVQLLAAGARLAPGELELRWIGGRFERVEVAIVDPEDPFRIQLVSQVDPDLPAAEVPLRRISLVIRAPTQIDALGLESATVTVRAQAGRLPAGALISLALDNGVLENSDLVANASGVAKTRMSSTRFGEGRLTLVGGPYAAAPVTVRYAPPWLFLTATLIGATLGAALYVYAVFRRGRRCRWLALDWVAGLIAGIGITAMLYAGIKLPEWLPMPENLVGSVVPFAVAFMAAAMAAAVVGYLTGMRPHTDAVQT